MYKKGGGTNGKLASIEDTASIGAVSYLALKVHQRSAGSRFREQVTRLNTSRFEFIPALHFLSLPGSSFTPDRMGTISLPDPSIDLELYRSLDGAALHIGKAIELSRRRRKKESTNL